MGLQRDIEVTGDPAGAFSAEEASGPPRKESARSGNRQAPLQKFAISRLFFYLAAGPGQGASAFFVILNKFFYKFYFLLKF